MNSIQIVGVGPGDPEMVTIKAVRVMQAADIVYVPESDAGGRSVAEKIIAPYVPKEKMRLSYFPMTNDSAELDRRYTELAYEMAELNRQGKQIVYVTLGDGMLYSTALYVATRLKKIGFYPEFIPGIPSYVACANITQIPLAEKRESFITTGVPDTAEEIHALAESFDTLVLMKISTRLPELLKYVRTYKPATATLVRRGTLEDEQIIDLTAAADVDPNAGYLAIAFIKRNG